MPENYRIREDFNIQWVLKPALKSFLPMLIYLPGNLSLLLEFIRHGMFIDDFLFKLICSLFSPDHVKHGCKI